MKRVRIAWVGALLVASAVAAPFAQSKSTIIQKIIVRVNGEIFTQTELEQLQIQALRDQNRQVTNPVDLTTDAGLKAALAGVTPQLLSDAIDELLLVQHGREMGVKFTEDNFKLAIENIKKENKMDDRQLQEALKQEGMTIDELRQNFERRWLVQNVEQREIMRNMTLTEEEARQYYKAHPDEFMKPPTVTLREILIAVPVVTVGGQATVNAAAAEAAKEKIDALRVRALKGEDFAMLVTEASEAGTKANGGIVGPMLAADLAPAVAAAVEKLSPGDVTEALRLGNGYRLFKLETRTAAELEAFDKVRSQIAQRIYQSRLEVEKKKFIERLRTQAVIEWKDDEYKKLYEQARAKTS